MMITGAEILEAQMVEFDSHNRYLRQYIPSMGFAAWYRPAGNSPEELSFKVVDEKTTIKLEREWKRHNH